jgi:hypothetical protein
VMFNLTQTLLIVVVIVLSVILSIVGVQVFFILREIQRSIQKVNKMLDDAGTISESIARPISSLSGTITNASGIMGIFNWLSSRKKKREEEEK